MNLIERCRESRLIPLTLCTEKELRASTDYERYEELCSELRDLYIDQPEVHPLDISGNRLVDLFRSNTRLRRLASLVLHPKVKRHRYISVRQLPLIQRLVKLWSLLLQYPDRTPLDLAPFTISLIIPCRNESPESFRAVLRKNLNNAHNPDRIQVVVVIADPNMNDDYTKLFPIERFGDFKQIHFTEGAGRGATQNFGAKHAEGWALAFCHADTVLPKGWDDKIIKSLSDPSVITSIGAFPFGVDLSKEALGQGKVPFGIRAVEVGVSLRCQLFHLPYGDQCLFMLSNVFLYIDGFANQQIMEDYDIVNYFRSRMYKHRLLSIPAEHVRVLDGEAARCSPRRWQKHGVLYTTLLNVLLVVLHRFGFMSIDRMHTLYYGTSTKNQEQ